MLAVLFDLRTESAPSMEAREAQRIKYQPEEGTKGKAAEKTGFDLFWFDLNFHYRTTEGRKSTPFD